MSTRKVGLPRGKTVARVVMALATILAATLLAAGPASAESWTYDLTTRDGNPGGRTYGTVEYHDTGGGCYTVNAKGHVDDLEADGYGVIVYLPSRDCETGWWHEVEAGYIGGADKPVVHYATENYAGYDAK